MSRVYRLERTQFVPSPREQVFSFFSDARNLERITPEFLQFHVLNNGDTGIHEGMLIDYKLKLFGLPFRWQSRIEAFEPGCRFIDVQLRGPYRRWRHLHEFADVPGGTEMRDCVDYEMPLGPLGQLAHALFVRRTLGKIFDFRREKVEEIFCERRSGATAP
jgi:ligand-binding SRPBCC domain-containing protein